MEKLDTKRLLIDWYEAAQGIAAEQAAALGIGKSIIQTQDDAYPTLLSKFARVVKDKWQSPNPYNRLELRHMLLGKHDHLEQRKFSWKEVPDHEETFYQLDAGRHTVLMDYQQIIKFIAILSIGGLHLQPPVILDRDFRIVDGINVVQACRSLGEQFYAIRLDYKHQASGLF